MGSAKGAGDNRCEYERGNRSSGNPPARCEPRNGLRFAEKKVPPMRVALRQARRNLLPYSLAVVFPGLRHGDSVDGGEQRIDAREFRLAFRGIAQLRRSPLATSSLAIVIRNQFFL